MGYIANHFTVSVTDCSFFKNLTQLNSYLKDNGFEINSSGGEIKGSVSQGLEQSSIMSKEIEIKFSDGSYKIPFHIAYADDDTEVSPDSVRAIIKINNDADVFMFTGGHGGSAKIPDKIVNVFESFLSKNLNQ